MWTDLEHMRFISWFSEFLLGLSDCLSLSSMHGEKDEKRIKRKWKRVRIRHKRMRDNK
jgi:hypothetical protein